jgi:hypothetical protein
VSQTTVKSPATVQWLVDNYEFAEGMTLPRSSVYSSYVRHCIETGLASVSVTAFGKLLRSVFLGLGTRRLGKSGKSKYHYTGICIKPGSSLNHMIEDGTSVAVCQQPSKKKRKLSCPSNDECGKIGIEYEEITHHSSSYRDSSTSLEVDWLMGEFRMWGGYGPTSIKHVR